MNMYVPKRFAAPDQEAAITLLEKHGFATLITPLEGDCHITHLPMPLDREKHHLLCHMARGNAHHKHLESAQSIAVFMGPHAYMSPNWYRSDTVPTWNYAVVHVRATAVILSDKSELFVLLDRLSQQYESPLPKPWRATRDSDVDSKLDGIVGFSLPLDTITAKFKLDQHLGVEAIDHLAANLEDQPGRDHPELAELMRLQVHKKRP